MSTPSILPDMFLGLTGHTKEQLDDAWGLRGGLLKHWFYLTVCMLKLNLTNDAASALTPVFIGRLYSERQVRNNMDAVFDILKRQPIMIPEIRMMVEHSDDRFPRCTAMVDCLTIACRDCMKQLVNGTPKGTGAGAGHHRVWKVEVWTTLDGIPIACKNAALDVDAFKSVPLPFQHFQGEYYLADKDYYLGANHMICPPSTGSPGEEEAGGQQTTTSSLPKSHKTFETQMSKVRSRVKHTFARLDKYHFFHGTDRQAEGVSNFVHLALSLEFHRRHSEEGQREDAMKYTSLPATGVSWREAKPCGCGMQTDPANVEDCKKYRDTMIDRIEAVVPRVTPVANRKRPREEELTCDE